MAPPLALSFVRATSVASSVACWVLLVSGCSHRTVEGGFWFEPLAFESARLFGPLTSADFATIESTARAELSKAFADLPITLSDRRTALYKVQVVQQLWDLRLKRKWAIAGESRAVSGFGGSGSLNFELLAANAIAHGRADAPRADLIAAIGRGIGRAAVHEFAHQLLPTVPIHKSQNINSYEYHAASRREQYYGAMEWDFVWPVLAKRLGK